MSFQDNRKPAGIMDLPEEILEQIFCLLCPYGDYKNAMLVCKLWHKIMQGWLQICFMSAAHRLKFI